MHSSEFRPEEHLTPSQLVDRWRDSPFPVSLVTLARWRRVKRGPSFVKAGHNGTRVFYPLTEVQAYESTLYVPNS
jgi:hypothetical protein